MREQFPGNGFEVNFICAPASSFFFLKKKIKVVMRLRRPGPADTVVEEQTRDRDDLPRNGKIRTTCV